VTQLSFSKIQNLTKKHLQLHKKNTPSGRSYPTRSELPHKVGVTPFHGIFSFFSCLPPFFFISQSGCCTLVQFYFYFKLAVTYVQRFFLSLALFYLHNNHLPPFFQPPCCSTVASPFISHLLTTSSSSVSSLTTWMALKTMTERILSSGSMKPR
jgi:hypothetical protein